MEIRDKLETGAARLEERVGPELAALKERLGDVNARAVGFVKAHPLQCLLGALAVGYLAGRIARAGGSGHARA